MSSGGTFTPKRINSHERPTMDVKHKNIKMRLFFNERVGPQENKNRINWVNSSHRSNVAVTVRPTVSFGTPQQTYYSAKRALSNYLKPDNRTISKILRFQNPQRLTQSRKSSLPSEKSLDVRSSGGKIHTQASFSGNHTFTQSFLGRNL